MLLQGRGARNCPPAAALGQRPEGEPAMPKPMRPCSKGRWGHSIDMRTPSSVQVPEPHFSSVTPQPGQGPDPHLHHPILHGGLG